MWDGPTGELTYSGLKVVELAEGLQGEIVGKLLADQGAEVIKVEPPDGSAGRHVGPYVDGHHGDAEAGDWRAVCGRHHDGHGADGAA